jgi:hypothetical protein
VLSTPQVQVFVLPYRAEGALTPKGRQLATILQRHVLYAALKYPSIAVEELTGDPQRCTYDAASARIVARLKPGQSAVFLWGRVFEQDQRIRLQDSAAFVTAGRPDILTWSIPASEPIQTTASLPADPVMFAPRIIPLNLLERLEPAQRRARRLHATPDEASSFVEIPDDPEARFGYQVLEAKEGWMHVRLFPAPAEGWIPAHALAAAENLKGTFPELFFIDGAIGYLELAAGGNDALLKPTLTSLGRYLELTSGRAESDARVLATVLQGSAVLRSTPGTGWSTSQLQRAQQFYAKARELAPTSTVANTFFLACGSALCARQACDEGSDALHAAFLSALAQDPTSGEVIENLNSFYRAAENGTIKVAVPAEKIAEQRTVIRQAQKR